MIDLVKRGHILGGGMITPDKKYFYLNIPKNASTFTNNVLNDNGWLFWNIKDAEFTDAVLILRDPLERWISGFVTYLSLWILSNNYGALKFISDYNLLVERLVFDTVVFDDHTLPQTFYINHIPTDITKHYVWADTKTLVDSIASITGQTLIVNKNTPNNSKESHRDNRILNEFIRSRLTSELMNRIRETYKEDYKLINSVNIHGK